MAKIWMSSEDKTPMLVTAGISNEKVAEASALGLRISIAPRMNLVKFPGGWEVNQTEKTARRLSDNATITFPANPPQVLKIDSVIFGVN